jgi:hypothetical protein
MSTDIFIRSYRGDFSWLEYCLKSIKKHSSGFNKIHVCVPPNDVQLLSFVKDEVVHLVEPTADDYMGQQITKLHADHFSHADFILHVDSDCIFTKPFSPESFMCGEKAIVLREDGVESPWIAITARILGWHDSAEYMRRLPILYPRWLYVGFRKWMEEKYDKSLRAIVESQPARDFSEFNTIGQWAYKYHHDAFAWFHPSEVEPVVRQFWSWGGLEASRGEVEKIIAE